MRNVLLTFICVILMSPAGYAALNTNDISFAASVNKTTLTLDDELILTVTVDGATGDFSPQLPSLPAFNVYARSASKQIHNFHTTSSFEYVMLPRFAGKTVIGPVTLQYQNKIYQTEPIQVTVYRTPQSGTGAAPAASQTVRTLAKQAASRLAAEQQANTHLPPLEKALYTLANRQHNKNYFMVAAVSNTAPYANQTFTLAVRFYYNNPFSGNAPYTAPAITNLFLEELGRSEGRQTIDGKLYDYIEIRYAATAVMPQTVQIGPASINFIPISGRDFSLFDRMFASMAQEPQTVQSNPITLTARAVPNQDQPASFYGAVGSHYTLSAELDREEVEAGEAVNLTVKVNGIGNLKSTSDLKIPSMPNFKVYDVVATSGAMATNGELKSYKIFKTVMVPVSSGQYTIPALSWSYYDPTAQAYRTLRTQPLSLKVTPSSKTDTGFDFRAQTDLGTGFQELGQDIAYLKSAVKDSAPSWLTQISHWNALTWAVATGLLLAGCFALADKQTLASKRTLSKVRKQLKQARTAQDIASALSAYIQVTYQLHTASLPLREMEQLLQQKGCSSILVERFAKLWQQLDIMRFAPSSLQGQNMNLLAQEALRWVKDMDKDNLR